MVAMLAGAFFGAFAESRPDRWIIAGLLLMLPGLWATSEAYHVLLGLPFFVEGLYGADRITRKEIPRGMA